MKRSSKVTLTAVAVMGLASCSRRRDPCEAAYFNEMACQEAVSNGGYYWGGSWYPMTYHYPYPYYFDSYRRHVQQGGKVFGTPSGAYARPSGAPASGGTVRGGFGETGGGHSSGS
jgi:hypothetical protein